MASGAHPAIAAWMVLELPANHRHNRPGRDRRNHDADIPHRPLATTRPLPPSAVGFSAKPCCAGTICAESGSWSVGGPRQRTSYANTAAAQYKTAAVAELSLVPAMAAAVAAFTAEQSAQEACGAGSLDVRRLRRIVLC